MNLRHILRRNKMQRNVSIEGVKEKRHYSIFADIIDGNKTTCVMLLGRWSVSGMLITKVARAIQALALVFCMGSNGLHAYAQDKVVVPKAGDPIRKTLFNVMRPAFEKELKQKVIFQVQQIRLYRNWAFVGGRPLQPNQKPIDYRKTAHQADIDNGAFDDGYCALLHKINGQWKLVTHNIGATDVVYAEWWREFKAPKPVFPYTEDHTGER